MKLNYTIFYSWQSDLNKQETRYFIQDALKEAAKDITKGGKYELEAVIDRDTFGLPGSPSIVESITEKIAKADVFVCDVSIINPRSKSRPTPNPNVLFELGYAVSLLGWERIILVQNTAYGDTEKLPFDLRGRRAVTYQLSDEAKGPVRKLLRSRLVETFHDALSYYGENDYREKTKMSWWGTWELEVKRRARAGMLKITRVSSDAFFFDLTIQDGARSGEVESRAKIVSPHSAFASIPVPDNNPCEIIFRRRLTRNGTWTIKVEQNRNCSYFQGMGSTFGGTYHHQYQPLISAGYLDEIDMNEIERITGNYMETFLNNFQQIGYSTNETGLTIITGGVKGLYTIMQSIIAVNDQGYIWCVCLDPRNESVRYFTNMPDPKSVKPKEIEEFIGQFSERKLIKNDSYSQPPREHSYKAGLRKRFSIHDKTDTKIKVKSNTKEKSQTKTKLKK